MQHGCAACHQEGRQDQACAAFPLPRTCQGSVQQYAGTAATRRRSATASYEQAVTLVAMWAAAGAYTCMMRGRGRKIGICLVLWSLPSAVSVASESKEL
jgi:hypothetical protein